MIKKKNRKRNHKLFNSKGKNVLFHLENVERQTINHRAHKELRMFIFVVDHHGKFLRTNVNRLLVQLIC
jgi:hypothetical protein